MVKQFKKNNDISDRDEKIKADIIILGCSLPGIVTAHKLKKTFGDTMDIVVLDLKGPTKTTSKCNVAFEQEPVFNEEETVIIRSHITRPSDKTTRRYLTKYTNDFNIPIPDDIIDPESVRLPLHKLFQHRNGKTVHCTKDYNDFDYLSVLEKFELDQYQTALDRSMTELFQSSDNDANRKKLLYYDQTPMENHICNSLFFSTSREIMRTTVRLVCGVNASKVSVLFYLHQCHRTDSSRNHLDGDNTRFREKLIGYCRKRLSMKLEQSIADITMTSKPIKEIRTYSNEQLILETMMGETKYICTLLAMAVRPDELSTIQVEAQLLTQRESKISDNMRSGIAKKFLIQYDDSFWRNNGFSGDILSIRGPILWAMERPKVSSTGSERYSALIGYLVVREDIDNSKVEVIEQLVKLFGEEAANPISYKESIISDIFVPCCGDYVAYKGWTSSSRFGMQWGTLDVFGEGDVAGALEAGHTTYLQLLTYLRPQAVNFDDLSLVRWTNIVTGNPMTRLWSYVNYMNSIRVVFFSVAIYFGLHILKSYRRNT